MGKVTEKRALGDLGEQIAAQFLESKGFKILERNYCKPYGEIDIIAIKGDCIRFVEVKTVSREMSSDSVSREMSDYRPEEQVHSAKLAKIARTAELYMTGSKDNRDYLIDVVGVILDKRTRRARCRFFEQVL